MKVKDPEGNSWRVDRRWLPWRRKFHNPMADSITAIPGGGGNDVFSTIFFVIGLIIAIPGIILGIVVALEFFVLILLFPAFMVARVFFGKRWVITVRKGRELWSESEAGDWQASGLLIREQATMIEQGTPPARFLVDA